MEQKLSVDSTKSVPYNQDVIINHLEISVVESEKRTNTALNIREYYTAYLIETKVTDKEFTTIPDLSTVWRRYTEFELFHDYLQSTYPYIVVPPLPEKRVLYSWRNMSTDTFDPDFIDRRRAGLENFLLRIAAHYVLGWDEQFVMFLQQDGTWKAPTASNGLLQKAESKIQTLSASVHFKKNNTEFGDLKIYSRKLYSNLHDLLKVRARVAEKQYNLYKFHANYGRVFSEWSGCEKEMGDALQKTGHYLDSLSLSIDSALEDEELLIDQLKEYLFFASTLEHVCINHDILQMKVESAEEAVTNKNMEKERTIHGKAGLVSRLFGLTDAAEVRDLKVSLLDKQIEEGTSAVNSNKQCLRNFSEKALLDIKRFQEQKDQDFKETLIAYTLLQLQIAKKGLQMWTQVRDCLQKIE